MHFKFELIYFFIFFGAVAHLTTLSRAQNEALQTNDMSLAGLKNNGKWVPVKWITDSTAVFSTSSRLTTSDKVANDLVNNFRRTHQVPESFYDPMLAKQAAACAQSYALANPSLNPTVILPRFNCANNPTAGITVGMSMENRSNSNGIRGVIADPGAGWFAQYVNNQNLFPPTAIPAYSPLTIDYTQMIWASSTQFGCGVSTSQIIENVNMFPQYIWMCMFTPAGNVVSQYPANVRADV